MMGRLLNNLRSAWFIHKLIFIIGLCLFTLAVLSYFHKPEYENGVWLGLIAFSNAFSGALSFLFGITIPFNTSARGGSNDPVRGGAQQIKCPHCGFVFDLETQLN